MSEVVVLTGPDGSPAANVPVQILDSSGATLVQTMTDSGGRLALPTEFEPSRLAMLRVPSVGSGASTVPVADSAEIRLPASPPSPRGVVFGQVLAPTGQGQGGIAVSLWANGVILAATVTDANGAWVLSADWRRDASWTLDVAGYAQLPVTLETPGGIDGPVFVRLDAVPAQLSPTAPASALLTTDRDTAEEIATRAPQLWARGVGAEQGSPCSPYAPKDASVEVYRFAHVVVLPPPDRPGTVDLVAGLAGPEAPLATKAFPALRAHDGMTVDLRFAALLSLDQTWQQLGLALGELIYSVPLAPCEQVKLAFVDWQAAQYGERRAITRETLVTRESLSRKRAISNVASLRSRKEAQQSTFGAAVSASYFGVTASAAFTHQWGSELTTSTARSTQELSDDVQQAANIERDTRMVSIVQVSQSEEVAASTRVVRNHNHAHTLTIQYYEVLQRYLVSTRVARVDPAVMVPFVPLMPDDYYLDSYGDVIAHWLRDETLMPDLRAWLDRAAVPQAEAPTPQPPPPPPPEEPSISVVVLEATVADDPTPDRDHAQLREALVLMRPGQSPARFTQSQQRGREKTLTLHVWPPAPLSSFDGLLLASIPPNRDEEWNRLAFSELAVWGQDVNGARQDFRTLTEVRLAPGASLILRPPTPATPALPVPTPAPRAPEPSARLIAHLRANALYYTSAILLESDPLLRWWLLSQIRTPDGAVLTDVCDPDPIAVVGPHLVFRLTGHQALPPQLGESAKNGVWSTERYAGARSDTVVVLPTGGTFAEAQLGSCPAAERIDDDLFWKWHEAPCPDEAPAISDEMVRSRARDMADLLAFVRSDLERPSIQIPDAPGPIEIDGETLQRLAEGLNLASPNGLLELIGRLADAAGQRSPGASSGSDASTEHGSPDGPEASTSGGSSGSSGGSSGGSPTMSDIGTRTRPWVIDNFVTDHRDLPAEVTAETGTGLYQGVGRSVGAVIDNEIVPGISDALGRNARARVTVVGHADDSGTEARNAELSLQRAHTVLDALVRGGIGADRITARGVSSSQPMRGYRTIDPHQRRVEIWVE